MTNPQDIPFRAKADNSTQYYVQILPGDYTPGKTCNLLIAFHGHGSDRWQYVRDARDECRAVRDVAAEHGMILFAVDYREKIGQVQIPEPALFVLLRFTVFIHPSAAQ